MHTDIIFYILNDLRILGTQIFSAFSAINKLVNSISLTISMSKTPRLIGHITLISRCFTLLYTAIHCYTNYFILRHCHVQLLYRGQVMQFRTQIKNFVPVAMCNTTKQLMP